MARRQLLRERQGHTLSTTDLVHEAYLRLVDDTQLTWHDKAHFCALACRCMRQILVDYARRRNRPKHGGDLERLTFKTEFFGTLPCVDVVLSVDEALRQLAVRDERLVQVVECRFFGGMSVEETAEALDTSPRTVARDWNRAKAYLSYLLTQPPQEQVSEQRPI